MKSKIIFLFVIVMFILSAAGVNAQIKAGSFSVSPIFGYSNYVETSYFDNSSLYGISLGYNFSEKFGIEGTYTTQDTNIKAAGTTS